MNNLNNNPHIWKGNSSKSSSKCGFLLTKKFLLFWLTLSTLCHYYSRPKSKANYYMSFTRSLWDNHRHSTHSFILNMHQVYILRMKLLQLNKLIGNKNHNQINLLFDVDHNYTQIPTTLTAIQKHFDIKSNQWNLNIATQEMSLAVIHGLCYRYNP